MSNSDLSEDLKSPCLENSENEHQNIKKRTTNTSEGATTEIETVTNVIAENETDENKIPEDEPTVEETVEETSEIETIEINNSDLSEPSKIGSIETDGPITKTSEIETSKIEENETVYDDDKLPETTNEEISKFEAQINLKAERNILKEVQPEKKIRDSAKKGKNVEILVNLTTERKTN